MYTTQYAGFWNRFAASWLDGIIATIAGSIITVIVVMLYSAGGGGSEGGAVIGFFISSIFGWLYFAILESSAKQATLGKMAVGVVVTDLNGNRLTFGKATARYFAKYLSIMTLLIGYIMAAFTEKKQALHDLVAGTLVYQKRSSNAGVIIISIFVGFIGLIFILSLIALLLFNDKPNPNKAKQSEGKQYISSINKGQQAYYIEKEEFSYSISDLGIGVRTETDNYSYDIEKIDPKAFVISTASAKDSQLKSYAGLVYVEDNITKSKICETDQPSTSPPIDFRVVDNEIKCQSDATEL